MGGGGEGRKEEFLPYQGHFNKSAYPSPPLTAVNTLVM